VATLNL